MTTIGFASFDRQTAAGPQHVLAVVRRRLLAAAAALDAEEIDEGLLRATAAELDAVVHRIRWVADVVGR